MAVNKDEANLFLLAGGGIEIRYSTSSFTGQPQLSYEDGQRNMTFTGSELRVVESEIGALVTVTLDEVPDLETLTLTLLTPPIYVPGGEEGYETWAILTTHHTNIGGAGHVQGPLKSYRPIELRGTAQSVDF